MYCIDPEALVFIFDGALICLVAQRLYKSVSASLLSGPLVVSMQYILKTIHLYFK